MTEMNEYLTRCPYLSRGFVDPPLYDTRLSPRGVEQASGLLRRKLASEHALRPLELVICSPLSRALYTADLGLGDIQVPCIVDPDLAERHYLSSDVGRPPKELAAEYPRFAAALETLPEQWWWRGSEAEVEAALAARLAIQERRELKGVSLPVEPQSSFVSRMERARDRIYARPETRIAVVSHWGTSFSLLGGRSLKNCELVEVQPSDLADDIQSPPDA